MKRASLLRNSHTGLRSGEWFEYINTGLRFFVFCRCGEHHAFRNPEFHLAWSEIGNQYREFADELLGLVHTGDTGEDIAGFAFAGIQRQLQ